MSTHFSLLIITSPSVFLSTFHNNIGLASLIVSLMYVCHTGPCSYFFYPDLLNPLYSNHPSRLSHLVIFIGKFYNGAEDLLI